MLAGFAGDLRMQVWQQESDDPPPQPMKHPFSLTAACALGCFATAPAAPAPPPNEPAAVKWDAATGKLSLAYHGGTILAATVRAENAGGEPLAGAKINLAPDESRGDGDALAQRFAITLAEPVAGAVLALDGTVTGGAWTGAAVTIIQDRRMTP